MINFSQYPEQAPFITPPKDEATVPYPIAPFTEAFFETKREGYIHFIQEKTEILKSSIQRSMQGYESLPSGSSLRTSLSAEYIKAKEFNEFLIDNPPYKLFYKETPKASSGNCLGADYVYDMYRNFPDFASIVKGMQTYEEYFIVMFEDIHEVLYQVFNKIGTRGQLFGYIDKQVLAYGLVLDNLNIDISGDNFETNLNNIETALTNYKNSLLSFTTNVQNAATDMRTIIEPVVQYLSLLEQAGSILSGIWGNTFKEPTVDPVLAKYNSHACVFTDDYTIKNYGIVMQIAQGMSGFLLEDRSNFELMITKAIGTSFNQIDLHNRLVALHDDNVLYIPDYPTTLRRPNGTLYS